MPSPLEADLALAHAMADAAAELALAHFHAGVTAETKPDASLVTVADRDVERMLRERLAADRPSDSVLGEEFGATGESSRTWILDPIDGTDVFVRRDPDWRIQIALQIDEEIVLAVVDEPANRRRWWATVGGGTWERVENGPPTRLATSTRSEGTPIVAFHPPSVRDRLPAHSPPLVRSAPPLVDVIRGDIDAFYVDCCQVWDHAPWILLVREAGGAFTDHEGGGRADRRGGLYSGSGVHAQLVAAIST
jgi:fructose-1,6-bisphosphatase/inositol monophosphatase family enzyme